MNILLSILGSSIKTLQGKFRFLGRDRDRIEAIGRWKISQVALFEINGEDISKCKLCLPKALPLSPRLMKGTHSSKDKCTCRTWKAAHRWSFMKCNLCMYKDDRKTDHRWWLKRSLLTRGNHIKNLQI